MIGPDEVRGVVDAYVDSYRRNDKQACIDLFAADAVWHDPSGSRRTSDTPASARSGTRRRALADRSSSCRAT